MKQNILTRLLILVLMVLSTLVINCEKKKNEKVEQIVDKKIAVQLLAYLDQSIPGSKFKTEVKNTIVKSAGNNRYWVTFKNISFSGDIFGIVTSFNKDSLKQIPLEKLPSMNLDNFQADEMRFLYGPKEEYLLFKSMKGISYNFHYPDEKPLEFLNFTVKRLRVSIGNKSSSSSEVKKIPFEETAENLKYEVSGVLGEKDNLLILLEIGKMIRINSGYEAPDGGTNIFMKDAPFPDLSKILQKELAVMDYIIQGDRINVNIKKNGQKWSSGAIGNVSLSFFLKPDGKGNFFKLGFGLGIKNLELSIPGKEEIQLLSNIKDVQFYFSIEHLSPEAVLAFIDFLKVPIRTMDITSLLPQGLKFMTEFIKSKSFVKFSLSPFKHYFGELEVKVEHRFNNLFSENTIITVEIFKVDDILKKLTQANVFSPHVLKMISLAVERMAIRKDNGNASMTIELKDDEPGKFFLNGKPMIIDPMMLRLIKSF